MKELDETITERRRQTRSSVYHYLYDAQSPCSKQDIARDLNLSLPTVYQNVAELEKAGLIEYCGASRSVGGRPAMQLRTVAGARCSIGISITGHLLRFIAVDLSLSEIAHREVSHSIDIASDSYSGFVSAQLERFVRENGISQETILGVGITVPGIILPGSTTVSYAPTLSLRNLSFQNVISAIPFPVRLENDGNSGGFAEWYKSADHRNMAFLSLSDGVGGAVFVNGDQYTGGSYRSGEFGHMCVERGGRICACGKRGCLEAYCSSDRLSTDLGITVGEFFDGLNAGNGDFGNIWEEYKQHLAVGIHNIRMSLDCDIVLGGIVADYLNPYLPEIRRLVAEADPFETECTYLRTASDSKYCDILGAALGFIRDFLAEI